MEEKRNLYFERSNGELILLANNIDKTEVYKEINNFLDAHNYKSYYTREWEDNGVRHYDVGSHTEFFLWTNKF